MRKLLCFFGYHRWSTVSAAPCNAKSFDALTWEEASVSAVAKILKCDCCSQYKGVITDGVHASKCDVDVLLVNIQGLHR